MHQFRNVIECGSKCIWCDASESAEFLRGVSLIIISASESRIHPIFPWIQDRAEDLVEALDEAEVRLTRTPLGGKLSTPQAARELIREILDHQDEAGM